MNSSRLAGPFSTFILADGRVVPLYLVPFDKEGRCIGPKTLQDLQAKAADSQFTDIYIYSHGWNNVFNEAVAHYTEFFSEYFEIRKEANLTPAAYRPMVVGVIWPSTALVSDAEEAPKFAADVPIEIRASAVNDELYAITELAGVLPATDVPRFFELADHNESLTRQEALELAHILLPVFESEAMDREGIQQALTPEKVLKAWAQTSGSSGQAVKGGPGVVPDEPKADTGQDTPLPAGFLDLFNPKEIIRKATVYLMKDRAGKVGVRGVGPMLSSLLAGSGARVHLAGHSFGAKVILSALALVDHPRKVTSVFLLQPAINLLCFANRIPENDGMPGAFRPALEKTEMPVFSTFSSRDSPLTTFFHLALRRDGDVGETLWAGGLPSRFAALGGFGPAGMLPGESKTVEMLAPPEKYDLSDPRIRLYAIDASKRGIKDHGDVRNMYTEWALLNLSSWKDLS